jgi:hypothetical protein
MGAIVKPDLAITLGVMSMLLAVIQERIDQGGEEAKRNLWTSVGAYCALCFCASRRGYEGFLLDLHGLGLHIKEGVEPCEKPHVVTPLLGGFKNGGENDTTCCYWRRRPKVEYV